MVSKNSFNLVFPTIDLWYDAPSQEIIGEKLETLTNTKLRNGHLALDVRRTDVATEIVGLLINYPFDEVINFLLNAPDENFVIFEQPFFDEARRQITREIATTTNKPKGTTALGKCRFCDCHELVFQTIQTRSGDEGMTVFIACTQCGRQWRD